MQEFHPFKCQLETWFWLCKIKAEEHLDYLLCILGKEDYAAMDCWVTPDECHKQDSQKFLNYIESALDDEISPQVRVYELEDVKKRSDESVDELVDRIHQLTCCAQIGNGSNATIEFDIQCRLIQAIPDADIELWKELLKVNHDKKVSNLLEISHTYYTIESEVAAMCAGKAIHIPPYIPIWCTLWPHCLAARQPWHSTSQDQFIWYIADTPSPAILGLLSCERLVIMKMNCAITVRQPGTKPPSPAPASITATTPKPATVHTAVKSIRSTDDLIKEFPD